MKKAQLMPLLFALVPALALAATQWCAFWNRREFDLRDKDVPQGWRAYLRSTTVMGCISAQYFSSVYERVRYRTWIFRKEADGWGEPPKIWCSRGRYGIG